MLSRKADNTKTIASRAKQPFQSSGNSRGRASGTWLFSKCRDRIANPSSKHAEVRENDPLVREVRNQAGEAGARGKGAEQQLIRDDDGEARQRDRQRVVMKHGDADERQREEDEVDWHHDDYREPRMVESKGQ